MKQEMKQDWRGPINEILYGLIFTREITDEIVNGCANAAVHYTVLGLGPEAYYRAIGEALASGEELDSLHQLPQFDHAQVVGFLGAVAKRLDELRPWPAPKYRRLDPTGWATFKDAELGKVNMLAAQRLRGEVGRNRMPIARKRQTRDRLVHTQTPRRPIASVRFPAPSPRLDRNA